MLSWSLTRQGKTSLPPGDLHRRHMLVCNCLLSLPAACAALSSYYFYYVVCGNLLLKCITTYKDCAILLNFQMLKALNTSAGCNTNQWEFGATSQVIKKSTRRLKSHWSFALSWTLTQMIIILFCCFLVVSEFNTFSCQGSIAVTADEGKQLLYSLSHGFLNIFSFFSVIDWTVNCPW